jgi:L-serine dehydratase
MTEDSAFRLLGPIMVGPSSSHTAGAVRIGRTARLLYGELPKEVTVYFHGSFADTWKGHGSDNAIIGGLLGYHTFDRRIKEADKYAKEEGMEVTFKRINLGPDVHPNTIKIVINENNEEEKVELIGQSVGGGDIVISEILGYKTEITGEAGTLILLHHDEMGTLSKITGVIAEFNLNILSLRSKDISQKNEALTTIEIEQSIPKKIQKELKKITAMKMVRIIPKITKGEEMF